MGKLILYIAVSDDLFIARIDGSIDWLQDQNMIPEGEDFGYNDFYAGIDTTLMGNKTYKQVMGFGGEFPYPDKLNYVVTYHPEEMEENNFVHFISEDIVDFTSKLKSEGLKDIWLVGGSQINSILHHAQLIDELIVTKMPVQLGLGIPLFDDPDWENAYDKVSTRTYGKGIVQDHYKK